MMTLQCKTFASAYDDSKLNMLIQSGASSRSKIGGAYFSDVTGSIQDPIGVPGPCDVTEP